MLNIYDIKNQGFYKNAKSFGLSSPLKGKSCGFIYRFIFGLEAVLISLTILIAY